MDNSAEFVLWATGMRGLAPKTIKDYLNPIRKAHLWMSEYSKNLDTSTLAEIKEYLTNVKPTPRTRNQTRCALVTYFEYLIDIGVREDNPALQLRRLRERRGIPKPLLPAEVTALFDAAEAYGPMFATLVTFYVFTGLRLSEVTRLRWDAIRGSLAYITQKGGGERAVFLNARIREVLDRWETAGPRKSKWVFPSPSVRGQPISSNWIQRKLSELSRQVGIPNFHVHRLRHTYGTAVYRLTRDLLLTQKLMGHTSVQSTQVYAQIDDHWQEDTLEELGRSFCPKGKKT